MHVVNYRGREFNLLTVGKVGTHYSHKDIQSAIDSITDSASDNPYLISLSEERFDSANPITLDKSHVYIIGDNRYRSILERFRTSGGSVRHTIVIQNVIGSPIVDSGIINCRIVRNHFGIAFPDAAVCIGSPAFNGHTTFLSWSNVLIRDCYIEGSTDAISIQGMSANTGETEFPRVRIIGNDIRSAHHGISNSGWFNFFSMDNLIRINSDGFGLITSPHTAQRLAGISTDMYFASDTNHDGDIDFYKDAPPLEWLSFRDKISVANGSNIAEATNAAKSCVAGYLFFMPNEGSHSDPTQAKQLNQTAKIVDSAVDVYLDQSYVETDTPLRGASCVSVIGVEDPASVRGAGWNHELRINKMIGRIRQVDASGNAAKNVYGILVRGGDSSPRTAWRRVHASQCQFLGEQARAGGGFYSLSSESWGDTIYNGGVFSDIPTQQLSGVITSWPSVA